MAYYPNRPLPGERAPLSLESVVLVEVASVLGADLGQGYSIAAPMEAKAMLDWIATKEWVVEHPNLVFVEKVSILHSSNVRQHLALVKFA